MLLDFPVGVEIETGNPGYLPNQLPETWCSGYDGSCGLEFKSGKIVEVEPLLNEVPQACSTLQHFPVHHKCGLHTHVGFKQVADVSAKYRVFRFFSCYEDLLYGALPPWAERAHFCTKLPSTAWAMMQNGQGFKFWDGAASRYWWMNGQAMQKHGTIEFRHLNGTVDPHLILGWVGLLQCIFTATVLNDVKLPWRDTCRATKRQLLEDAQVKNHRVFGDLATNLVEQYFQTPVAKA